MITHLKSLSHLIIILYNTFFIHHGHRLLLALNTVNFCAIKAVSRYDHLQISKLLKALTTFFF